VTKLRHDVMRECRSSEETSTTEDSLLAGRVKLLQPRRGYRVAVDAVLLAAATQPSAGQRILDLGAGVGAVGLCLAVRVPETHVVCLELQPELVTLAEHNVRINGLGQRVEVVTHDIAAALPPALGLFDQVTTNPPFLPASRADPSPHPVKALATVESSADLARWLKVATDALKPDGSLTIIHRTDRLEEIATILNGLGWRDIAIKRLPPVARVLIRGRRGKTQRLRESAPLTLHKIGGSYTDAAEAVLRHAHAVEF
jgi:tRNA1(Val) A37 N6-methylase TrmN6